MAKKPWQNLSDGARARTRHCPQCGSIKPGGVPLSLKVGNDVLRGYWHLRCFDAAKRDLATKGDIKRRYTTNARLDTAPTTP